MQVLYFLSRVLRMTHWIKNGILVMPLVFAERWGILSDWLRVGFAFVAFCAVASAGYLVNDIQDREKDRLHPTKKNRPIASGAISVSAAYVLALVLLIVSVVIGYMLVPGVAYALVGYALLMYTYSRILKRIPLIDLGVIAIGFVIRVLVGALAIAVPLSGWLIVCTFIVALLLGVGKRVVELERLQGTDTRKTLGFYTRERTIWMERVLSVCAVIAYAAYTLSGRQTNWLMLSVIPVSLGIYRYSVLLTKSHAEGPTEMLVGDRVLQLTLVLWMLMIPVILFFHPQ